jgi:hypothetical protein
MTSVATDATDNARSVVLFLRAVVLAVTDLATVLASLVLVVSEGTVECGEFSELVSLEFVLAFRNGRSSLNDVVDEFLSLVDLLFGIGHDETVQIFFLVAGVRGIRPTLTLLYGALATNGDLGA